MKAVSHLQDLAARARGFGVFIAPQAIYQSSACQIKVFRTQDRERRGLCSVYAQYTILLTRVRIVLTALCQQQVIQAAEMRLKECADVVLFDPMGRALDQQNSQQSENAGENGDGRLTPGKPSNEPSRAAPSRGLPYNCISNTSIVPENSVSEILNRCQKLAATLPFRFLFKRSSQGQWRDGSIGFGADHQLSSASIFFQGKKVQTT